MKNLAIAIFLTTLLSACFASRCPDKSCHVQMEHRHSGQIFRSRAFLPTRFHSPIWYLTKNSEKNSPDGTRKNTDVKSKKKFKKLLPWEKV